MIGYCKLCGKKILPNKYFMGQNRLYCDNNDRCRNKVMRMRQAKRKEAHIYNSTDIAPEEKI